MRAFLHTVTAIVVASGLLAGCATTDDDDDTTVVTDDGTTVVTEDDDDIEVRIVAPEDDEIVNSPFTVEFEAEGVEIGPADEGEGHHFHLIVDDGCATPGEVIPADDDHLHFGQGQTETQLELAPGQHELCLQVADGDHVASDDTDTIRVNVEE